MRNLLLVSAIVLISSQFTRTENEATDIRKLIFFLSINFIRQNVANTSQT